MQKKMINYISLFYWVRVSLGLTSKAMDLNLVLPEGTSAAIEAGKEVPSRAALEKVFDLAAHIDPSKQYARRLISRNLKIFEQQQVQQGEYP